jgi:type II secretory pathway component GspD/PulD (secretin)
MDIPWIGGAFSRTSDTLTNTEIVILITPHIVKGGDDYEKTRGTIKGAKTYNDSIQMSEPAAPAATAAPAGAESK